MTTHTTLRGRSDALLAVFAKATPGPWHQSFPPGPHVRDSINRVLASCANDEQGCFEAYAIAALPDIADCLREAMTALAAAEKDAAVGKLVREKLVSGNAIPVERCTIWAREVSAIAGEQK